jgi:hypothetical protein
MYVIARSAVYDSQNILTIGMKLRIIFLLHNTFEIFEKTLMFWRILCWKCQILSSLIENLLNIKTYAVIFGMHISHL